MFPSSSARKLAGTRGVIWRDCTTNNELTGQSGEKGLGKRGEIKKRT